jgi:hypothetical protein
MVGLGTLFKSSALCLTWDCRCQKGLGDRPSEINLTRSFLVDYHPRNPPIPKTFRKSAIDDIISFFVQRLLFSPFTDTERDRSSVISLSDACHGRTTSICRRRRRSTLDDLGSLERLSLISNSFRCRISYARRGKILTVDSLIKC